MPLVQAPPIEPMHTADELPDLVLFAKAYFNINLTKQQIELMEAIAAGKSISFRIQRRAGIATINKIAAAYIKAGLDIHGRERLPQVYLRDVKAPIREKKAATQSGKILALISRPSGAFNFELSRIALMYCSRISELREEGHNIIAERQYLKNGKASNTWKYYLIGD